MTYGGYGSIDPTPTLLALAVLSPSLVALPEVAAWSYYKGG